MKKAKLQNFNGILRSIAFAFVAFIFGFFPGGIGGCGGGTANNNPPNIAGLYTLTNTECPGAFDDQTNVVQDGTNLVFQATHTGFVDIEATIDNDGKIKAHNANGSCDGEYVSGIITGTCTANDGSTCHITYTKT